MEDTMYKKRVKAQLDEWVKGNNIHNQVDDECVPDFSCCNKEVTPAPPEVRQKFVAGTDDERDSFCFKFLVEALNTAGHEVVNRPNPPMKTKTYIRLVLVGSLIGYLLFRFGQFIYNHF